jgi:hypothetical protein
MLQYTLLRDKKLLLIREICHNLHNGHRVFDSQSSEGSEADVDVGQARGFFLSGKVVDLELERQSLKWDDTLQCLRWWKN